MLTRCANEFRFSSLAENWSVHTKLVYKYQILYLDRITIDPWLHLVNDIDVSQPKIAKKIHKTPYFGDQGHPRSLNSAPIEILLVIYLGPISHRY